MIQRIIQAEIEESLSFSPIVGIIGSRQVGKTTIAKEILKKYPGAIYLDLELPSTLFKLQDAEYYLRENAGHLVIIDEIQQRPDLFQLLRALTDEQRTPARFLILGSSSPELIKRASENLSGRIIYHELTPLILTEANTENISIDALWRRGGYPDSILASSEKISYTWRGSFIRTYLERDIPQFGLQASSTNIRNFWTMIAHLHGSMWNASRIASSLGVSAPTAKHYLDILTDTFIVNQLQPYFVNIKKRLVKSPKTYIRDSGLLHALLGLRTRDDIMGHPVAGFSWEGFVIEQISNMLPEGYGKYFYRTSAGAEIDLVISNGDRPVLCVEIKFSLIPKVSAGFWNGLSDLQCKRGIVVYPGTEILPLGENVFALPITKLQDEISKLTTSTGK